MTSVGLANHFAARWRLARLFTGTQRTLLLPAVAIVLGLGTAGLGLFRAAPHAQASVPPGYIALVNQKGILMTDWITQTQAEEAMPFEETTPAARERVLQEMIDEELLIQRGMVLDLPETTIEVRDIMATAINNQVAAQVLARAPTEEELRAYYEAHRERYTARGSMHVHDLVLHVGGYENADQTVAQARADAAEAAYQLRAGASLDYVKQHFGLVDSGRSAQGEEADFAAKLHLGDKLHEVAVNLNDGEVSEPIVDSDGVHLLVMEHREPTQIAPFESARVGVYNDLRAEEASRATRLNLENLRHQAQILIAPGHGR